MLSDFHVILKAFSWQDRIRAISTLFIIGLLLTGCAQNDMTDLENFIKKETTKPGLPVEPLPPIPSYEAFPYGAEKLRDPFEPFEEPKIAVQATATPTKQKSIIVPPDLTRNRETLEIFPLDTLRMVGTLEQKNERWGLVRSNDGVVHKVKVGNYVGQNHGLIGGITDDRIFISEKISDGAGGWLDRSASLSLVDQ